MNRLFRRPLCRTAVVLTIAISATSVAEAADPAAPPGAILWKHKLSAEVWGPLTQHEGVLYFGGDDGKVFSFDPSVQKSLWEFRSDGRVRSGVKCVGDKTIFASDDGHLYAVELKTGRQVWRFALGSADKKRVLPATTPPYEYDYLHSFPVIAEGTIYIGSMDGNLYAVDQETGERRWTFPTKGKIRSTPIVNDSTVYFGSWDRHLYAVGTGDGELKWKFDSGNIIQGSPAVSDGKVIVGSRSAKVFAVDAASGEKEWEYVHADGSWVESSPVIRDGVVYIGSSDALKLFAFDLATGEPLWEFKTTGWSWSTPLVTDDVVYIGGISASPYYFPGVTLEAGFYAIDRKSGEKRWSMAPEPIEGYITGGVLSSPVIIDDTVYVAALDGYLYALQK